MPASVVTFTVQIGSGGYSIARAVAESLGFRYYDWEITSEAASRAGVSPDVVAASERVPGFMERMMRRLVSASAVSGEEAVTMIAPEPAILSAAVQSLNSDDYRQFIERVVAELAERGDAVIVGHAAQAILKKTSGTLKVLLYGSASARADRLAAEQKTSAEQAMQTMRQSDKDRSELFARVYKLNWLDASNYDLAFKTDHLPVEVAVQTVVATAKALP